MRRARRDRARAEHREGGPIEFLWPLLFSLCFILLVAVAIHGFTDHTSMGHGMGAGRRGGPDDPLPYDSLDPGDIGAVWTTARVLRHFRARTAADVRIAWDVADLAALDAALAPVAAKGGYLSATANDIVHVPVAWSKALAGNGGAGAPVVARSTHLSRRRFAPRRGNPSVAPSRRPRPFLARRPRARRRRSRTRPDALVQGPARGRPGPATRARAHPPRTSRRPAHRRRRDPPGSGWLPPADGVRVGSGSARGDPKRRGDERWKRDVRTGRVAVPARPGLRRRLRRSISSGKKDD